MTANNNNGSNVMEQWLSGAYDYELPQQGEVREGIILELDENGALIDVGLKHDGRVPRQDLERLSEQKRARLKPGKEVSVRVIRAQDQEDGLILSLYEMEAEEDWHQAKEMLESGEIWRGEVTEFNRGGLLVEYGQLQGFVPASHLQNRPSGQSPARFENYIGQTLPFKVIEVDRTDQRLILSERLARAELREEHLDNLLDELEEGQVRPGVVRHLTDFGAFVSLGPADGLIHVSELAWHHVGHPSEILEVGEKIEVYVLNLDPKRRRINLSLKALQPDPWSRVEELYQVNQIVTGTVSNVQTFGAFVVLPSGIEGLVHISELAEPIPDDPREFVTRGDELVMRILQIDTERQRMALSLKRVAEEEAETWQEEQQHEAEVDDEETVEVTA